MATTRVGALSPAWRHALLTHVKTIYANAASDCTISSDGGVRSFGDSLTSLLNGEWIPVCLPIESKGLPARGKCVGCDGGGHLRIILVDKSWNTCIVQHHDVAALTGTLACPGGTGWLDFHLPSTSRCDEGLF